MIEFRKRPRAPALFLLLALMLIFTFAFAESDPPVNRISMKKARAVALRKFPGKVRDFEFEIRKKKWVYFFKIAGKDQKYHSIVVDAVTGKITSKTSEPMPIPTKVPVTPTPLIETPSKNG